MKILLNDEPKEIEVSANAKSIVTPAGKCVCSQENDDTWVVMFPNGEILKSVSKKVAEKACFTFFKKNCPPNKISYGAIEWHYLPIPARIQKTTVFQPT